MRKIRIAVIVSIVIIGIMLIQSYSETLTRSTNLSNESIGGVNIGANINDSSFITRYGKPLSKQDNAMYDYYEWEGELSTASIPSGKDKGSIMRLIISGEENSLHTAKGIKIGDTKEKVLAIYGNKYYKSGEQGADIIGYIDHEQDITLEFWCVNSSGLVAEIRLDDSSVR